MRRTTLLLVVMGVFLVIGSAVALAANKTGTNQAETLDGTVNPDNMAGGGGSDTLNGKGDNDVLFGDWGNKDTLNGGPGDDFLNVADGAGGDIVNPGSTDETNGDTCVIDVGDFTGTTQRNTAGGSTNTGGCEILWVVG